MTVCDRDVQQLFYFFYAVKERAAVDMECGRSECGIPVVRKPDTERFDKIRVKLLIVLHQLVDMMMDTDLQTGIVTV